MVEIIVSKHKKNTSDFWTNMKLTLFTCKLYIPEENWKNKQVNKVIRTTNVVQISLNYDISTSQKYF